MSIKQLALAALLTFTGFVSHAQVSPLGSLALAGGYDTRFGIPSVGIGSNIGGNILTLNYAWGDDISTFCIDFDPEIGIDLGNSGLFFGLGGGYILRDDLSSNEDAGGFIGRLNVRIPIIESLHAKYSLGHVWPNEFSPRESGISHYFGLFILF